jgi:hypothetical protein
MSQEKKRTPGWVLLTLLKCAALAAAAVFFYVTLVYLVRPELREEKTEQPSLRSTQAYAMTSLSDFPALVRSFPVPVLGCQEGRGLTLISGGSADVAYKGGLGRIATLVYQSGEGYRITAQSVYPARALSLLSAEGWRLADGEGPALAGVQTVRMDSGGSIRLHMQTGEGLYTLEVPGAAEAVLEKLIQPFVLFVQN